MMTDLSWLETTALPDLMAQAAQKRDDAFGRNISYSRKVFIPLTLVWLLVECGMVWMRIGPWSHFG